jgi:hypothetical protein
VIKKNKKVRERKTFNKVAQLHFPKTLPFTLSKIALFRKGKK